LFDDPKLFDTYFEKMPIEIKNKYIFYELMYCEHLKIVHLLYPMHILKNVSYYLWRHISLKKSDTMAIREDLLSSNTKKRHWTIKENRGEAGRS
jgi:hypothetical protein